MLVSLISTPCISFNTLLWVDADCLVSRSPVVRTNPVTGWKSLYGVGHQIEAGHIDNVTPQESEILKAYFLQLITDNHDLQVRFRWSENDMAMWDNRSVLHTATNDYEGKRQGNWVVSLGEKPFLDLGSVSRREALRNA
jgi:alpha-ketoglutarate-dependent taurine dioxygenase